MIRLALLLAVCSVQGACSPYTTGSRALLTESQSIIETHSRAGAPAPEIDQGAGAIMSNTQIVITSHRGDVTAELADNAATRALLRVLPLTIEMQDHLRQEKTGNLASPLPEVQRQTNFSAGTLGVWGNDDFVIYYRNGRVPEPGIIAIGRVIGDVTTFDHPGPVTVRIARAE